MPYELQHLSKQRLQIIRYNEQFPVPPRHKPFLASMIHERHQRIIKPLMIQQPNTLVMQLQLPPGDDLKQFIQRPIAAGQGDERIGEFLDPCLPLVHRADDLQAADSMMSEFFLDHRSRDDANNLAPRLEGCLRDLPHQANIPTAVNDANATQRQRSRHTASKFPVRRIIPLSGATIQSNLHPFPFARSQ